MRIGIIGFGFVGSAVYSSYKDKVECLIKDEQKGYHCSYSEIKQCDAIFICVPSPETINGECDPSILQSVIENLSDYSGVIISKVTAPPDVYSELTGTNLFYVPEFLTARNSVEDYKNTKNLIIGGSKDHHMAEYIIKLGLPNVEQVCYVTLKEASVIKYTTNTFLSVKVVFMNEIKQLCDKISVDYDTVKQSICLDSRIGSTHLDVPGYDGQFGYGGACFPKDMSALLKFSEKNDLSLSLVSQAIITNNKLREIKISKGHK
jgi:nucleotide sugar dehydrogenase